MYAAANDCYIGVPASGMHRVAYATIYFTKSSLRLEVTLLGTSNTVKVLMSKKQQREFSDAVATLPFLHSYAYAAETYPEYCI